MNSEWSAWVGAHSLDRCRIPSRFAGSAWWISCARQGVRTTRSDGDICSRLFVSIKHYKRLCLLRTVLYIDIKPISISGLITCTNMQLLANLIVGSSLMGMVTALPQAAPPLPTSAFNLEGYAKTNPTGAVSGGAGGPTTTVSAASALQSAVRVVTLCSWT